MIRRNCCFLLVVSIISVSRAGTKASQQLLQSAATLDNRLDANWTLPPSVDETGHVIFASVNGLLRHWSNALYRNGHTIIPGIVRPGTFLYHGAMGNNTDQPPPGPEWVSFDPEHAYGFSSRMYTFEVTKPLKILYFDGSSAAKMPSGTMDTQEILTHGELRDCEWMQEFARIEELCKWGKEFGINGYLRMEFDFEVMIYDFERDMEQIGVADLLPADRGAPKPRNDSRHAHFLEDRPRPPNGQDGIVEAGLPRWPPMSECRSKRPGNWPPTSGTPSPGWKGTVRPQHMVHIAVVQAGNWHNYPGLAVTGVSLDYTKLVTFFDPKYKSLVTARREQSRGAFRAGNITRTEAGLLQRELMDLLSTQDGTHSSSGIDWASMTQMIVDRTAGSLDYLLTLTQETKSNLTHLHVRRTRWHLLTMLTPYMLASSIPPLDSGVHGTGNSSWLAPTVQHCATYFTRGIRTDKLTPSEQLIKHSVEAVVRETCRTLGLLWLDGFDLETRPEDIQLSVIKKWEHQVSGLIDWLGWPAFSRFHECGPACSPHEMCTLPQWPFDIRWGSDTIDRPFCMSLWDSRT